MRVPLTAHWLLALLLTSTLVACVPDASQQPESGEPPPSVVDDPSASADPAQPVIAHTTQCPPLPDAAATTTVPYASDAFGLSFSVPYNPAWIYGGEELSPYVEHDRIVEFGAPRTIGEGGPGDCTPGRTYQMEVLPAASAQDRMHALRSEDNAIVPNPTVETVGAFTVVKYVGAGLCTYPTLEIIGKSFNYSFSPVCGEGSDDEWNALEEIVKSVQFLGR
jgi:hypothetical protein